MIHLFGWEDKNFATKLVSELQLYLLIVFAVVGGVAVGYAIYLGFLIAKAEDEGKRKAAKSRIFKTIIGLMIIAFLTTFLAGNPPLVVSLGLLDGVKNMNEEDGEDDEARKSLNINGLSVTIVEK